MVYYVVYSGCMAGIYQTYDEIIQRYQQCNTTSNASYLNHRYIVCHSHPDALCYLMSGLLPHTLSSRVNQLEKKSIHVYLGVSENSYAIMTASLQNILQHINIQKHYYLLHQTAEKEFGRIDYHDNYDDYIIQYKYDFASFRPCQLETYCRTNVIDDSMVYALNHQLREEYVLLKAYEQLLNDIYDILKLSIINFAALSPYSVSSSANMNALSYLMKHGFWFCRDDQNNLEPSAYLVVYTSNLPFYDSITKIQQNRSNTHKRFDELYRSIENIHQSIFTFIPNGSIGNNKHKCCHSFIELRLMSSKQDIDHGLNYKAKIFAEGYLKKHKAKKISNTKGSIIQREDIQRDDIIHNNTDHSSAESKEYSSSNNNNNDQQQLLLLMYLNQLTKNLANNCLQALCYTAIQMLIIFNVLVRHSSKLLISFYL